MRYDKEDRILYFIAEGVGIFFEILIAKDGEDFVRLAGADKAVTGLCFEAKINGLAALVLFNRKLLLHLSQHSAGGQNTRQSQ
jgi:hypothetical protein